MFVVVCRLLLLSVVAIISARADVPMEVKECRPPFCQQVSASLHNAILNDRVAPGVAVAALNRSHMLYRANAGRFTYDEWASLITDETLFDMASCTKVLVATTATAILYQRGLLSLDERVSSPSLLGPAFASNGKGAITVRNLLLHNAGFAEDPVPWYSSKLFPCPNNKWYHPGMDYSCVDTIYTHLLLNQTLINPVGAKYLYSDLSMIVLMFVLGKVVQAHQLIPANEAFPPLCADRSSMICNYHAFARREFLDPLGLVRSVFAPNNSMLCPPQWLDDKYRHARIMGFVSDDNAYALGGISGHAGIFMSIMDVVKMMRMWTFVENSSILNATTIRTFTTVSNPKQSTRALGWDTNLDPNSTCGTLSKATFMHTGYTGTSVCGDFEKGVITVLLGNGRYPDFGRSGMIHYRYAFNSLIESLL